MTNASGTHSPASKPHRIVHLISRDFRAIQDGGSMMSASLASALAAQGELHIIDMDRRPYGGIGYPNGELLPLPFGGEARFYSSVDYPPADSSKARQLLTRIRRGFTRRSRHYRRQQALAITRRLAPDVVVADDLTGCLVARDSGARCRIVHTHNLESALHEAIATQTGKSRFKRKARQYAQWEGTVLPAVEQVWAVSEADAAHYRQLGVRDVRVLRVSFPNERFEAAPTVGTPGIAVFFGSLWYGPNIDAVRYLARLAPKLRELMPQSVIRIVGGRASAELIAEIAVPGIEYLGFVDDLRAVARDAAAILVPLDWGGGTKVKTAEALALGKPVVSTPEGMRGLAVQDGDQLMIRALGTAFDDAVLMVLQKPADFGAMAARGQRYAEANFSQAAVVTAVAEALQALAL